MTKKSSAVAQTKTQGRIEEYIRAIFEFLQSVGGRARGRDAIAGAAPKLRLSSHELERTKSGAIRWETQARWYTLDCVAAGFLTKQDGYWTLTPTGKDALRLPHGELMRHARQSYLESRAERPSEESNELPDSEAPEDSSASRTLILEKAREDARTQIEAHLNRLKPYEFQRLVAALLKAMGYHVPFVAPAGPDGGIDVIAYRDPLGATSPRIKVQVKHTEAKIGAKDVRELEGLLRKEGDVGLFVSSGGFSPDALREIRSSTKHIEAMDQDRLIMLWKEHYPRVAEEDKVLLPIVQVSFLSPQDG